MNVQVVAPAHTEFYDFPARRYLEKYYSNVGDENAAFIDAVCDFTEAATSSTDRVIEVAGGPCLYSLVAMACARRKPFEHITFTDVAAQNLTEVDWWLRDDPRAFDYAGLLAWLERHRAVDARQVVRDLRASRWRLVPFDWRGVPPWRWAGAFDVVSSHFFAESATEREPEFHELLGKIGRLGRPGATVLLSFIGRSAGYSIDGCSFPAFPVDELDVLDHLDRAGVRLADPVLRSCPAEDLGSDPGYESMLFVGGTLLAR